jgi:hypothetical protein
VCERLAWFDLTTKGQEHRPHGIIDAAVGDCHIEDGLCLVGNRTPDAERLEHAAWSSRYGGGPDIIACPAKSRISERNDKILAERLPQGDGERKPGKSAACYQDIRSMVWKCQQNTLAFQQNVPCGAKTPYTSCNARESEASSNSRAK